MSSVSILLVTHNSFVVILYNVIMCLDHIQPTLLHLLHTTHTNANMYLFFRQKNMSSHHEKRSKEREDGHRLTVIP